MILSKGWAFPDIDSHFHRHVGEHPLTDYQQVATDTAYKFVKNFNSAIDVGANIGLHSVRFAQKFKNVYSFEPVTSNFECLKLNASTFDNIKLYNLALGETDKTDVIELPKNSTNCGAYSFVDFKNSEEMLLRETIQIQKLDNFNLDADLIKIDVQGYETLVLNGAVNTIKKNRPVLIIEIIHQQDFISINNILQELEYKCISAIKKDKIWIHNSYEN